MDGILGHWKYDIDWQHFGAKNLKKKNDMLYSAKTYTEGHEILSKMKSGLLHMRCAPA